MKGGEDMNELSFLASESIHQAKQIILNDTELNASKDSSNNQFQTMLKESKHDQSKLDLLDGNSGVEDEFDLQQIIPLMTQINVEQLIHQEDKSDFSKLFQLLIEEELPLLESLLLLDEDKFEEQLDLFIKMMNENNLDITKEEQNLLVGYLELLYNIQKWTSGEADDVLHDVIPRQLMGFLEQWQTMTKEVKEDIEANISKLQGDSKFQRLTTLIQDIIERSEHRTNFMKKQIYVNQSTITRKDLVTWLTQAVEKHFPVESKIQELAAYSYNQPLQMNKANHFFIQANNLQKIEAISNQLMPVLNQTVKNSQFLKTPSLESLTFTLQPKSLGEVTVRLVQSNNEMIVKLYVTTNAAKRLFEANIHQLKPMFAPHQISIEKEPNVPNDKFFQDDLESFNEEEEEQQTDDSKNKDDQDQKDTITFNFEDIFNKLKREVI